MKKLFCWIICCLWMVATTTRLPAQSEAESSTLVISAQQSGKQVEVHVGDRLNYLPRGGRWQRGGKLEAVGDSSLTVGKQDIAFQNLEAVQLHKPSANTGVGLLVGSLIAEPIALLLWVVSLLAGLDNPTPGQRALMLIMGIVTLFLLPAAIILSIILIAVSTRRFTLSRGWSLRKG